MNTVARPWFGVVFTSLCAGVTLVLLFMAVAQWTGLDPARDDEAALGGVMLAILTGAMTVAGALLSRRPRRLPLTGLAAEEESLAGTLQRLSAEPDLPSGLLDRAWRTAVAAAGQFRIVAARVDVLEVAARRAPSGERAVLDYEIGNLAVRLDELLAAYRALVASLATPSAVDELVAATQHLAGVSERMKDVAELR